MATNSNQAVLRIDGRTYTMHKMGPLDAVAFAPRVGKLLAGAVGASDWERAIKTMTELMGVDRDNLEDHIKGDPKVIMDLVRVVLPGLTGVDLPEFTDLAQKALAYEVYAEDKKLAEQGNFDDWFRQYPGDMLPVQVWAIWEHAKPFLSGSGQGFLSMFAG